MVPGIVFINQATGYLTIDIVNKFTSDFENVVLITGSIRVQDIQLDPKVKIEYIALYDRGNNIRKAISWIIGSIQIFILLRFKYTRYDKFFFTVPPTAYLMASWFNGNFSILVFDLYPEALCANGFSNNGLLYKWWENRNRKVFKCSYRIFTLSEIMSSAIKRYSPGRDVIVIPNWSAFSHLKPIKKGNNIILRREGFRDKFIVQYSGNIGVTHNVETLIDVANCLRCEKGIVFQIIGRGEKMNQIARMISEKALSNCILLPFRKDEELFESLCAADLAVIILDPKTPNISIPSKIYNIMAAGLPVMAIASYGSGLADLVVNHNIGKVLEKNDIQGMCSFVIKLRNDSDLRRMYTSNSIKASLLYTSDNAGKYLQSYIQ